MDLPQQSTINQYLADGFTTEFDFTYYIQEERDIDVYVTPPDTDPVPSDDIKILDVNYEVTIDLQPINGGVVTFFNPPVADSVVTLVRNIAADIDTAFSDAQNFNGQNLDDNFTRVTLVAQQNKTNLEFRVLRYAINDFMMTEEEQELNTVMPRLTNADNQIWKSQSGRIIASVLEENPDVSTLRADLLNKLPVSAGASIVGFYDEFNSLQTDLYTAVNALIARVYPPSALIPVGTIIDYGANSVPDGFLECKGDVVSQATYAALYAVIGSTWNTGGEGAGNFRLPNFQRRTAVGSGGSGTGVLQNTVGSVGGAETHVLTLGEMPAHDHSTPSGTHFKYTNVSCGGGATNVVAPNAGGPQTYPVNVTSQGSNTAHTIMQPSAVVKKLIRYA